MTPLDEFMDEGDPRQPRAYRATREQIETAFAGLHAHMQSDPELWTLVERARDDWTAADRLAPEAFSVRRAPGDPHGAELMDSFGGLIVSAVDKLGAVYGDLEARVRADHESALRLRPPWWPPSGFVPSIARRPRDATGW